MASADTSGLVRFVRTNAHPARLDGPAAASVGASVVIHVVVFLALRTLALGLAPMEPIEPELPVYILLPSGGEELIIGEPATGETLVSGDSDPLGNESVGVEGPVVTGGDVASEVAALSDALGDRLRRGRVVTPSLAVPTTQREPEVVAPGPDDEPEPAEDDAPEPDADVTTIELADIPESDSLFLGRLSGLRPELAFMTASAWVLIRNQEEVEAFLRRTYREGRLDPAVAGNVAVTLWIDQSGTVEWAEVSKSSGRIDLDEVALALFNEVADFRPARDRGDNVSRSVTFSLNFPW